jgi:beta-lactamase class D
MQLRVLFLLAATMLLFSCAQTRIKDHPEWGKIYEAQGIKDACFILRDNNHEAIHYFNKERSIARTMPASTFKVFISLIALETAIAPDDRLVIKWDSTYTDRPETHHDMDMREALKISCNWYFETLITRIGAAKMQHYIDTIKYGNMNISGDLQKAWVNDSLQISADEQVGFIKRLYFAELPVSERSQRIVKDLMLQESTPGYKLYYKTGTAMKGGNTTYWITGFVERIQKVKEPKGSMNKTDERNYPYFFSSNFQLPSADTSKNWYDTRIAITKDVLRDFGAIPKDK